MNTVNQQKQLNFYARMAGLSYLIFVIAGLLMNTTLDRSFVDISATGVDTILSNEWHFRLAAFAEVIIFSAVVSASVFFYQICRTLNKPLSQIAICCRLVELIMGSVAALMTMVIVVIANSSVLEQALEPEQIRLLIRIVAGFNLPAYEYSWIFMGFAGTITFSLFYQQRYIPKALAAWGIITYTSFIAYPVAKSSLQAFQKK